MDKGTLKENKEVLVQAFVSSFNIALVVAAFPIIYLVNELKMKLYPYYLEKEQCSEFVAKLTPTLVINGIIIFFVVFLLAYIPCTLLLLNLKERREAKKNR